MPMNKDAAKYKNEAVNQKANADAPKGSGSMVPTKHAVMPGKSTPVKQGEVKLGAQGLPVKTRK